MKSENRRVCAVKIATYNFTCLIISVYLPCDTYNQRVQKKYVDNFDYIECLISSIECDSVIICVDYNTSFERESGQVDYLNDFISRSNMNIYWDNDKAMKDFTYTNYSRGHKSCIDHIIMSGCIFDGIIRNNVIYDGDNPSNHNLLFWLYIVYRICPIFEVEIQIRPKGKYVRGIKLHLLIYNCTTIA